MDTKSNILKELKELSPTLFELKSNERQVFKVPDGYFSELKSAVFTQIELGFGDDLGKSAFKVPEDYFAGLSDSIMDAIEAEESPLKVVKTVSKPPVIELSSSRKRQKVKPLKIYVMAAAIAGLLLFMTFLNGSITNKPVESVSFSDVALEYIEDGFDDIESEDLYALLDLSEESIDLSASDAFQEDLNEYLNENIEDLDISYISSEI